MIRTLIEWAHHSLNFWWGCAKVSPGCEHCYAETLAKLFSRGKATWGPGGKRWLRFEAAAMELQKIVRLAKKNGVRPRVFINSMSDTFEANPLLDVTRCMMLTLLADTPECDVLLLTKRPENVLAMVPPDWVKWHWPAHVWIGTTVENQKTADERIPELLQIPARVRFLSCEPLLGPVDLSNFVRCGRDHDHDGNCDRHLNGCPSIGWVIVGGESGGKARPMHYAWAAGLRKQCVRAGVPFFFKQWGEWVPMPGNVPGTLTTVTVSGHKRRWERCGEEIAVRMGKKEAGRVFDGRIWDEVPLAAPAVVKC